jgi:hypothetical protein
MSAKYWASKRELREWLNLLQQERRDQANKAGLCRWCLKKPKLPDLAFCEDCKDKERNRRQRYLAKGLCYCGKARREGSKFCEIHFTRMKERQKARAEAGICMRCDEPRYKESIYCRACLTLNRKENRHRMGLQPWYPGCGGTVPMDSDEPDFELTNGDELFNG